MICVDCVMFHANGDIPSTWGEDDIPDGRWAIGEDRDPFSWECCHSCGTAEGGARWEAEQV